MDWFTGLLLCWGWRVAESSILAMVRLRSTKILLATRLDVGLGDGVDAGDARGTSRASRRYLVWYGRPSARRGLRCRRGRGGLSALERVLNLAQARRR